ncbi:uncharacterized protein BJX67DRAFT_383217 [Aspergillus lucknowensis]|uniref:Water stress and hypersensitive response domain-containing protein n=1 Tax=Aspergillus lucknowensis TaxID=176173 RepID=A0ABR4LKD5_9EURO
MSFRLSVQQGNMFYRPLVLLLLAGGALFHLASLASMSSEASSPKLEVRLKSASIPASFDAPTVSVAIQVAVHNHAASPVTLLSWGSPLDPRANLLGVFEIRDAATGEAVALDTVKFARKLPPPAEDFVEIPPGEAAEVEVTLPRVPLVEGRPYAIQAKGWWQAVWEQPLGDVPAGDREKLAGALRGSFESSAVEIRSRG